MSEKWKNLYKKVNRGVILACVLLVGLVAFFIIDSAGFKKDVPGIEDALTAYAQACSDINLLPKQYLQTDAVVSTDSYDAQNAAFVEKYFTEYSTGQKNRQTLKQSVTNNLNTAFSSAQKSGAYVDSCELSVGDISSISKQGTNAASVTFTAYDNTTGTNAAWYLSLFDAVNINAQSSDATSDGDMIDINNSVTYTVTLIKTGGVWKFAESSMSGSGFGIRRAIRSQIIG